MKNLFLIVALLGITNLHAKSIYSESISGLLTPESVVQAENGDLYVSEINEFDIDGDGQIKRISTSGKVSVYAKGLDDPKGLALINGKLYVADKTRILEVTGNDNWRVYADESAFPITPQFLNDLVADQYGNLYVSDSGDLSSGGAIYKITKEGVVSTIVDSGNPNVLAPNGLWFEGRNNLLTVDFASGILYRVNIGTGKMTKLAEGFGGGDGIIKTKTGKTYVSDWKNGYIYLSAAGTARTVKGGFNSPADIALSHDGEYILIPVMKAGTLEFMKVK
ncbi:MAG: SMP-30/gluconolactonase/LRE family protein [Methylophilaceae bacterium]